MSRNLKLYITGVVATSVVALVATTLLFPVTQDLPIAGHSRTSALMPHWWASSSGSWRLFWPRLSRSECRAERSFNVSTSTVMAATILGGPAAGAWVGLLGTTEVRELRGRIPWYGTLANHAGIMIPAVAAGLVMLPMGVPPIF